jgi:hypothetical protein
VVVPGGVSVSGALLACQVARSVRRHRQPLAVQGIASAGGVLRQVRKDARP